MAACPDRGFDPVDVAELGLTIVDLRRRQRCAARRRGRWVIEYSLEVELRDGTRLVVGDVPHYDLESYYDALWRRAPQPERDRLPPCLGMFDEPWRTAVRSARRQLLDRRAARRAG
jgi:hypothetical protein